MCNEKGMEGGNHANSNTNDSPSPSPYNDTPYECLNDHLQVPNLIPSFSMACTMLRMARGDLRMDLIPNAQEVVDEFYSLLDNMEHFHQSRRKKSGGDDCNIHLSNKSDNKFLIEIEGLDGSGKTTLCQALADHFRNNNNATSCTGTTSSTVTVVATKTPSKQLKNIRPLWDHRGGLLARAFYMVSNYVLEYELMHDEDYHKHEHDSNHVYVIIVDRWYASTLAYTVAYRKNNNDSATDDEIPISDLPSCLFTWPSDLHLTPHLLLLLDIDQNVRQARVSSRALAGGGASLYNPWDDRLKDSKLGTRILEALKRIRGPKHVGIVNANKTVEEVVQQATDLTAPLFDTWREERMKRIMPQVVFQHDPLSWWKMESKDMNLCDVDGKRCHHALWNLQVSYHYNGKEESENSGHIDAHTPPLLKTVGLDRIDESSIYYWTCANSFPSENHIHMASCLWMAGDYPIEQQWRVEGYIQRVTEGECELWGFTPPPSLVAHLTACSLDGDGQETSNRIRPENYETRVQEARACPNADHVCLVRFVPKRIEILRGGPSTRDVKGYPQRLEWVHNDEEDKWSIRSILPFPTATKLPSIRTSIYQHPPLGVTIALTGCHTSGKTTVGKALAKLLGWNFDPELGEILRGERDQLKPGGHMSGDGSGEENSDAWDDLIHRAEVDRDEKACAVRSCRIVETWHIGNAKWYQLRQKGKDDNDDAVVDLTNYRDAVAKHQSSSVVLLINLILDSSDIVMRRREICNDARARLPLADEEKECRDMFQVLQSDQALVESFGIPVLNIDNGTDGKDALNHTLRSILSFIQQHSHKRI